MIKLLAGIFIKRGMSPSEERSIYGKLCSTVGIILNIILCTIKLTAGLLSGSIAVTADAVNNLSDAGSSIITLAGFKLSEQKPDSEHPFGHGRIEYIAGLIVSLMIILMGFELGKSSIQKIINPEPVNAEAATFIILAVSVGVKLYMCSYNTRIGKKINSAAMKAAATDSLSDCISTTVVFIATIAGKFISFPIDGVCGTAVSVLIFIAGIKATKETVSPLLGEPPSKEFVESIEKIVTEYPSIVGIHDLIVHDYGPGRRMISLHAEVPASGNILQIHDEIDNAERKLTDELGCHAVIHMDPIESDNPECIQAREQIKQIVKSIDEQLSIHDFRMVTGPTHTNLIFDVVVPHKYGESEKELKQEIDAKVKDTMGEKYFTVTQIEQSYIQ